MAYSVSESGSDSVVLCASHSPIGREHAWIGTWQQQIRKAQAEHTIFINLNGAIQSRALFSILYSTAAEPFQSFHLILIPTFTLVPASAKKFWSIFIRRIEINGWQP